MSDEPTPAPPRRPSPTSRARRIGGRPTPTPAARPGPGPLDDEAEPTPALSLTKASPPKPTAAARPAAEPETEPSDGGASPGWLRWIPAGLLAVATVVLLVVLAVASHGVYWAKTGDSAGARAHQQEQVLASAKKCFALVNTYDYRKLDGLVVKDLPCTTGKFKSDLKEALQKTIIPQAPKAKAVQSAQVNKAGVSSVSSDGKQVVTLIYAQLVVSNSTTAKTAPRTDLVGAVVTMDRVGDQWLISKVGFDAGNGLGG